MASPAPSAAWLVAASLAAFAATVIALADLPAAQAREPTPAGASVDVDGESPATEPGRPLILVVHGRGMLGHDTTELRAWAQRSLESGARSITGSKGPLLRDGDVRLVWYADVLDPESTEGCAFPAGDPRARRADGSDGDLRLVASQLGGVLGALAALFSEDSSDVQLRALAGDLEYVSDARKRCAAERRLTSALEQAWREGRPVVLVAHSFGSIIAYDRLAAPIAAASSGVVERLVTIGAMIGAPELRRLLFGNAAADSLGLPSAVRSWVNVRNPGDALAAALTLPDGTPPASDDIHDLTTMSAGDEADAHELGGYLRDRVTARAVLEAWCGAFGAGRAPHGCP